MTKKETLDIESVLFTINDEYLSEDNEIHVNSMQVHDQLNVLH